MPAKNETLSERQIIVEATRLFPWIGHADGIGHLGKLNELLEPSLIERGYETKVKRFKRKYMR